MQFRRTSYQFGCLQQKERKKPKSNVWVLRYREPLAEGGTKLASRVIGSVEQYPTASAAWKAAEALRLSVNPDNPVQHGVSWGGLIDKYIAEEMPSRRSTAESYRRRLRVLKEKWGGYALGKVRPFAFREWLKTLKRIDGSGRSLAPKTKAHFRSLMHILYDCAVQWEFADEGRNPFGDRKIPIKNASKHKKRRSLDLAQFDLVVRHRLIAQEPFRTAVILAICLGLRCSELFALRWSDVNWKERTLNIERGIVRNILDNTKTDPSEAFLPLAPELLKVLRAWYDRTTFDKADDFIFASPYRHGKVPYSPEGVQKHRLRFVGEEIGFSDTLGWHTFRHTYRTFLDKTGAPLSVQQALMRHSDPRTTMEYGEGLSSDQREHNRAVVKLVLIRGGRSDERRKVGRG